jgi:hypothetical protein
MGPTAASDVRPGKPLLDLVSHVPRGDSGVPRRRFIACKAVGAAP